MTLTGSFLNQLEKHLKERVTSVLFSTPNFVERRLLCSALCTKLKVDTAIDNHESVVKTR